MAFPEKIFHLAIPSRDLDESLAFYVKGLGCRLARRMDDRITLEFFGDQVVCHLSPESIEPVPQMYPRHFGATFGRREDYDRILNSARERGLRFFHEPTIRFQGRNDEHAFFFLIDPSNNLIEFKYYLDSAMMY